MVEVDKLSWSEGTDFEIGRVVVENEELSDEPLLEGRCSDVQ
jgi:hypothetical protein